MTFFGEKERLRRLGDVSRATCVQEAAKITLLDAMGCQLSDETRADNQANVFAVAREHGLTQAELTAVIHMNVVALSAGETDGR